MAWLLIDDYTPSLVSITCSVEPGSHCSAWASIASIAHQQADYTSRFHNPSIVGDFLLYPKRS